METKPYHGEVRMDSRPGPDGYIVRATMFLDPRKLALAMNPVLMAANRIGAQPDDLIPGLWHAPGYPELTTGQLLSIAS